MIRNYHRPTSLEAALALAARSDAVVVAGGTVVAAIRGGRDVEVVDLQALDLRGISSDDGAVHIGSTTTLTEVSTSLLVPGVVRDLAKREAPSAIRNAATVGGTIATAHAESELLTGLLAFGATVEIARVAETTIHLLDDLLDDQGLIDGGVITAITIRTGGSAAAERTGRTPMDVPIVMAVAHRTVDDEIVLAMSGVADRPVLVEPSRVADLDPPSDFRGTSDYRLALADVLALRALAAIGGGASL